MKKTIKNLILETIRENSYMDLRNQFKVGTKFEVRGWIMLKGVDEGVYVVTQMSNDNSLMKFRRMNKSGTAVGKEYYFHTGDILSAMGRPSDNNGVTIVEAINEAPDWMRNTDDDKYNLDVYFDGKHLPGKFGSRLIDAGNRSGTLLDQRVNHYALELSKLVKSKPVLGKANKIEIKFVDSSNKVLRTFDVTDKVKTGNFSSVKSEVNEADFKFDKEKYRNLNYNGYVWRGYSGGIHMFTRKNGSGVDYIECGEEQLNNGDIEYMTQHGLTIGPELKKKIQRNHKKGVQTFDNVNEADDIFGSMKAFAPSQSSGEYGYPVDDFDRLIDKITDQAGELVKTMSPEQTVKVYKKLSDYFYKMGETISKVTTNESIIQDPHDLIQQARKVVTGQILGIVDPESQQTLTTSQGDAQVLCQMYGKMNPNQRLAMLSKPYTQVLEACRKLRKNAAKININERLPGKSTYEGMGEVYAQQLGNSGVDIVKVFMAALKYANFHMVVNKIEPVIKSVFKDLKIDYDTYNDPSGR